MIATLAILFALAGSPGFSAEDAARRYVDPAICASCHSKIAGSYLQTGMGRSFYRPSAASVPSGSSFYHEASDRYYDFSSRDGKFYLSRHQTGYRGEATNRVEKSIDYVVGSGNHARTYLHRNSEGQLIELPVSFYGENGGSLAMSPGYDNPHQEDFRRPAPDDCMFCHNGYPRNGIAEGIDCQRCHGPGSAHVNAAALEKAKAEEIREAIVNPRRLDRERQLDDCMQCHLETTSLRLPNAIRNYGRTPFSYRPGEPLSRYEQFFDRAPGSGFEDRFEVAHQAYRLRKSACFLKSRMTCTTCHDPHQALRGQTAIEHYVSVCRNCHSAAHQAGTPPGASNCLECHMWKRRTQDAVHVVMTDHFIQRRKPAGDPLAPLGETAATYQGEVVPYYPERPQIALYLAVAQVQHESNLAGGIPRLEQAIAASKPDAPEFYVELGIALSKSGSLNEAIRWYQEALRRRNGDHRALRELAAALALSGNLPLAIEAGERASAQRPADTVALTNLGNAYLRSGNPDRAKQILSQALAINPDLPEAENLLGLAWLAQQSPTPADASFRLAIAIQPDLAAAHNNLANLLAGRKDYAQAAYHFQKAVASDPSYAEAHHSYGLLLVLMNSLDPAIAELREAVRLEPDSAQTHIDFADVLLAGGRAANAGQEYRRAIQLDPKAYEAHLALGTILRQAGNMAEAREHFQKAAESDDPSIRNAALRALR